MLSSVQESHALALDHAVANISPQRPPTAPATVPTGAGGQLSRNSVSSTGAAVTGSVRVPSGPASSGARLGMGLGRE
jgi:hypothetical protein